MVSITNTGYLLNLPKAAFRNEQLPALSLKAATKTQRQMTPLPAFGVN